MEEYLPKIAFRQPVGGLLGKKPAFDRALLHALVIDSTAVIFDLDVNVVPAVVGAQHDLPGGRFASGDAVAAVLDAVRHGVAHQMYERIGNLLNDIVVQLGFASGKIQLDMLAG